MIPQCLTWLLHNYFLPTLNPAHAPPRPLLPLRLRPAEPLLRQYKSLCKKSLARGDDEASLYSVRREDEVRAVLREIERWLAEARVAGAATTHPTTSSTEFGGGCVPYDDDDDDDYDGEDPNEVWALDRLCDALLARGALVPLSHKWVVSLSGEFDACAEHEHDVFLGNVRRSRAHTSPRRPSSRYGRRSSRASLWDPRTHTCARCSARTSSRVCSLSAHAPATTMTTMARGRHTSSVSPRGARGSSNGVLRTRSTRTFPHAARTSSFS